MAGDMTHLLKSICYIPVYRHCSRRHPLSASALPGQSFHSLSKDSIQQKYPSIGYLMWYLQGRNHINDAKRKFYKR